MRSWKSFFNSIRPSKRDSRVALKSSPLGKLSPDLMLYLEEFLEPESTSAFVLSCRLVYFTLGNQSFKLLEKDGYGPGSRYMFLTLLERQLPDHIICYHCKKLHSMKESQRYTVENERSSMLPCSKANLGRGTSGPRPAVFLHWGFATPLYQMVGKLNRQKRNCDTLLKSLSDFDREDTYSHVVTHDNYLVRIVNGSLLYRHQEILMVRATNEIPIQKEEMLLRICPHITYTSLESLQSNNNGDFRIPIKHWDDPAYWKKSMMCCEICSTEFKINFKKFGRRANAMIVTRWKDLGCACCGSRSEKWQKNVAGVQWPPAQQAAVICHRADICRAFEGKEYNVFRYDEVLTAHVKTELLRRVRSFNLKFARSKAQQARIQGENAILEDEIDAIRGQIRATRGQIRATRGQIRDIRGQIRDIRGQIRAIRGDSMGRQLLQ